MFLKLSTFPIYREKEATLEDLLSAKKLIIDMQGREKILKEQLNMYTEKYADFQSSLQKSNDVFETYKNEMSKVSTILNSKTNWIHAGDRKSLNCLLNHSMDNAQLLSYLPCKGFLHGADGIE